MASENKIEQPVLAFSSQSEWRKCLEQNHALSNGIWLQFYKKGSGTSTVVYAEALDEALCFGWIDGQLKRGDENFPTLFGALTMVIVWLMVEELEGKIYAKIVVSCALLFSVFVRLSILYQPNAFDILACTALFYFLEISSACVNTSRDQSPKSEV